MTGHDYLLLIVGIPLWILWWSLIFLFYKRGDKLFFVLSERYPEHYKIIGEPKYFTFNFTRNARAQSYLGQFTKGIPSDLPSDEDI